MREGRRRRRLSLAFRVCAAVAVLWALGAVFAYEATVTSIENGAFDGLNNLYQIPFAFPWWFEQSAGPDHIANARSDLSLGLLNAALILVVGAIVEALRHVRDR